MKPLIENIKLLINMYVLVETPAGFALFKVLKEGKLKDLDSLHNEFATKEKA